MRVLSSRSRITSLSECSPELRRRIEAAQEKQRSPSTRGLMIVDPPKRRQKFNAKKVMVDGHLFDSKLEAQRYGELKLLMQAGEVSWFAIQPTFLLPGGVVYRADFVIQWKGDGPAVVEDAKGLDRQAARNKRKILRATYNGLEVQLWPLR